MEKEVQNCDRKKDKTKKNFSDTSNGSAGRRRCRRRRHRRRHRHRHRRRYRRRSSSFLSLSVVTPIDRGCVIR